MDGYREQHVLDEDLSSLASAAEDEETAGSEGLDGGSDEDGVPDDLDEDDSADCDGALYPRAGLDGSEADSEEVDSGSDGEGRAGVAALLSPSKRGPPFELGAFDSLAAGADFDTESDNDSVRKASFPLVDMGAEDGLAEDRVPSAEGRKSPQRHSKRIEGRRLRSIYDENDYVLSNGKLCPITPSSAQTQGTPILFVKYSFAFASDVSRRAVSAFDPVRKYFLSRLAELVVEYGGEAGAIAGWTVDVMRMASCLIRSALTVVLLFYR